jgi:hypothetical protein
MLKWIAGAISLFLLLAMVFGTVSISVPIKAKDHDECVAYAKQNHSDDSACKENETLWERGLSDPIAYETMWLALFTWALASVGVIGGILTYEQIRLARDEFNAANRPEIVIHSVKYAPRVHKSGDTDLDRIGAQVIFFNKGTGNATLKSINYSIEQRLSPLESDIVLPSHTPRRADLVSGRGDWVKCESDLEIRMARMASDKASRVFLIGKIIYEDQRGLARQVGFCRVFGGSPQRRTWDRVDEPEYEYSY